jgi:hypothetical protein
MLFLPFQIGYWNKERLEVNLLRWNFRTCMTTSVHQPSFSFLISS